MKKQVSRKPEPNNTFHKEHRVGYFQKENPGKTIYVGNLNYDMDEIQLFKIFKSFGDVKYVKLVTDKETGKSKGIAFVQMPNVKEALDAIATMDGQVVDGRTLKVSEAIEQKKDISGSVARKPARNRVQGNDQAQKAPVKHVSKRQRLQEQGLNKLFNHLKS